MNDKLIGALSTPTVSGFLNSGSASGTFEQVNGRPRYGQLTVRLIAVVTGLLVILYFIVDGVVTTGSRTGTGLFALSKEQVAFWDTLFKGVGGVIALTGAAITVSKYFSEKRKENHNALLEVQAPFIAKRQEVYYRLVSTTATISNGDPDDPKRDVACARFWRLYWGAVPLVADQQVSAAVDQFMNEMASSEPITGEQRDINLRNSSMNLARACRNSLGFGGPPVGENGANRR